MKQIRKRLTYANVMSSLAVFLVLGGATAFAAGHLGKNTVGTKQLKKNAVTTAKIKKEAVNGAKIKAGSVGGTQLASGAVSTDKLGDSSVTGGKLANSSVSTDKLGDNAVTTGKIANDAVTGDKVNESTLGEVPTAASATTAANSTTAEGPVAFAHVSAAGALLGGRNVSVTGGNATYYCFSGLPFEPAGIQATADYWNGSPKFDTMVQAGLASSGGLGGTGCPVGTQAFVHGVTADNDAPSTVAFYAVFFK